MKMQRMLVLTLILGLALGGCGSDSDIVQPASTDTGATSGFDKNGTETLGLPSIPIADGDAFAEGGVGMVGVNSGVLTIDVPLDATIQQVLLYWAGGTTAAAGDNQISIDGNMVTGELIGGPTLFFENYRFSAFRADITGLDLVAPGANSFTVADFDFTGVTHDENNGASIVVIYDTAGEAELSLLDGLDMAFFNFSPTLDATVPQTFTFAAEPVDRTAQMLVVAGSVGEVRPNEIRVTTIAGDQVFANLLNSTDGLTWDSLLLDVDVPAGATELTVQLISTESLNPLGASLGWLASGLSVPQTALASIGDRLWVDANMNGVQDPGEVGYPGATVELLDCMGNVLASTTTDADGFYGFTGLFPGDYNVRFTAPEGYDFTLQDMGDDALDSDADIATGETACTTLEPGENDLTWDAGIFIVEQPGCSLTIGFWKTHAGFGPQADVVTPLLPISLGDEGGAKTLVVSDAATAVSILSMKDYGGGKNGIAKLYAQLLGAKLNVANGASDAAIAAGIAEADAFLADHNHMDWYDLSKSAKKDVLDLMTMFDDYNNGEIGPGHCD